MAQLKGALAADDRLVHIRESSRVEEETTKPEIKAIELLDFPCSAWEMKSSLLTNHLLICSSDSWQNSQDIDLIGQIFMIQLFIVQLD